MTLFSQLLYQLNLNNTIFPINFFFLKFSIFKNKNQLIFIYLQITKSNKKITHILLNILINIKKININKQKLIYKPNNYFQMLQIRKDKIKKIKTI
jgi:hypothetical protein